MPSKSHIHSWIVTYSLGYGEEVGRKRNIYIYLLCFDTFIFVYEYIQMQNVVTFIEFITNSLKVE